jgi:hypothetical protein
MRLGLSSRHFQGEEFRELFRCPGVRDPAPAWPEGVRGAVAGCGPDKSRSFMTRALADSAGYDHPAADPGTGRRPPGGRLRAAFVWVCLQPSRGAPALLPRIQAPSACWPDWSGPRCRSANSATRTLSRPPSRPPSAPGWPPPRTPAAPRTCGTPHCRRGSISTTVRTAAPAISAVCTSPIRLLGRPPVANPGTWPRQARHLLVS